MTLKGTGRQGPDPAFLNPDWMERFLGYVADGLPPYRACEAVGVSRYSFWKWWRLGGGASVEDHVEWQHPEDAREPYLSFVNQTNAAEAGLVAAITRTVTQKAKTDGEHGLKVLKSRYPEDWNVNRNAAPTVVMQDAPSVQMSLDDFRLMQKQEEGSDDDE